LISSLLGGRHHQVRFGATRVVQHLRRRAIAAQRAHVERIADAPHPGGRLIDHRDVVTRGREHLGCVATHLAGTADDDVHECETLARIGRRTLPRREALPRSIIRRPAP
jgi:hypothetical protein